MAILFVNSGSNTTPGGVDAATVTVTIPATAAGNDLFVVVNVGDDPAGSPELSTSVVAAGATFSVVPDAVIAVGTGTRLAQTEIWHASNIAAGITSVVVTRPSAGTFGVEIAEYSGVKGIGHAAIDGGISVPVTINLATQDGDNWVVAGFAAEDFAGSTFTGASPGTARELVYVLGAGTPDVPGALVDNTSAAPATVTTTVTTTAQSLWSASAVELRSIIGSGFRSFSSMWFGPESAVVGVLAHSGGPGFRSFQSFWFGPDGMNGNAGGGGGPVTVTSGRKLISQAFTATLNGELT